MVIELFVTARHPMQQFITCHNETESKSCVGISNMHVCVCVKVLYYYCCLAKE